MPTVFTILNCGTNSDRNKRGEIVADFGAALAGIEHADYLINDGPGSTGGNLLPGTFDPYTKTKSPKSNAPDWSKTPTTTALNVNNGQQSFTPKGHGLLTAVLPSGNKLRGGITGDGWDDNLRHSIATIADVFGNSLTGTINMLGWSRGAVTCMRLANWIEENLGKGFRINIFAVDPVAGLNAGSALEDTYKMPASVKNYVCILAMDEARGDFLPQDRNRVQPPNGFTNLAFLPFPGVHDTVVKAKDPNASEVNQMVRSLAYSFLAHFGTKFSTVQPTLSSQAACKIYAQMMLKRDIYRAQSKSAKNIVMGGTHMRDVQAQVQSYVRASAAVFVNDHHRICFQKTFSDIYSYLFTGQKGLPNGLAQTTVPVNSGIGQKLMMLQLSDPDTFRLLEANFAIERTTSILGPSLKIPPAGSGVAGQGAGGFAPSTHLMQLLSQ